MLRIHHLFFINFMGIAVVLFFITSLVTYTVFRDMELEKVEKNGIQTMRYVEKMSKGKSFVTFKNELVEITEFIPYSIEVYTQEGLSILGDSTLKKNYPILNYEEFVEARNQEFGSSVYYNYERKENILAIAKIIALEGNSYYLRLLFPVESPQKSFYSLWMTALIIFFIFIVLAYLLSLRLSKTIQKELLKVNNYLGQIEKKNFKATFETHLSYEFRMISRNIQQLVGVLEKRQKQKHKYAARLRFVNKQRNTLISAASHEFKNPLASIIGYTQTLQDDDTLTPIQRRFLQKIIDNAKKIGDIIDRVALSITLENNETKLNYTHFDLVKLIEDVVHNLEKKYKHRRISLWFDRHEVNLYADKMLMELVVINLLDNALKYSEDDIFVRLEKDRFFVKDQGYGISQKELSMITEKFYRVHKMQWDNSMGLGLAIVTYILKAHKSSLQIESKFGSGSTFSFDIKPMVK